jgi:aspartate/glutamate racemase
MYRKLQKKNVELLEQENKELEVVLEGLNRSEISIKEIRELKVELRKKIATQKAEQIISGCLEIGEEG